MIYKSKAKAIAKEINPLCMIGSPSINYIDMKVELFIKELLKYSLDNMVSQKKTMLKPEHISEILDKISLILKIYPKGGDVPKSTPLKKGTEGTQSALQRAPNEKSME